MKVEKALVHLWTLTKSHVTFLVRPRHEKTLIEWPRNFVLNYCLTYNFGHVYFKKKCLWRRVVDLILVGFIVGHQDEDFLSNFKCSPLEISWSAALYLLVQSYFYHLFALPSSKSTFGWILTANYPREKRQVFLIFQMCITQFLVHLSTSNRTRLSLLLKFFMLFHWVKGARDFF